MSTLLVDELYPGVVFSQNIKITRNIMVAHIRPWIYKHGVLQDGDLKLEVYEGATLLKSSTINYADINDSFTKDFGHGYIRFDFDSLKLNIPETLSEKEYTLKFSMINHTLDESNFIGMIRQYERKIYPTYGDIISGEGVNDIIEPLGLEIYEYVGV